MRSKRIKAGENGQNAVFNKR